MKRNLLLILVLFLFCGASYGLSLGELGDNITIDDKYSNSSGSNPSGIAGENNETEYRTIANQDWDLEAIFWNSSTKNLYILGGFNYLTGVTDTRYSTINMGDIFIGNVVLDLTRTSTNENSLGPEAHLQSSGTYNMVNGAFLTYGTTDVPVSGSYAYKSDGSLVINGGGSYEAYQIGSQDWSAINANNIFPTWNTDIHYALEIQLSDIGANLINSGNLIRTTFRCGNDLIKGQAAPVPEPATMLLLGAGLVGLAGFGRKKFKK